MSLAVFQAAAIVVRRFRAVSEEETMSYY